jgi:hypothetical protein
MADRTSLRLSYSPECREGKFSEVPTAPVLHRAVFLCREREDVVIHT